MSHARICVEQLAKGMWNGGLQEHAQKSTNYKTCLYLPKETEHAAALVSSTG